MTAPTSSTPDRLPPDLAAAGADGTHATLAPQRTAPEGTTSAGAATASAAPTLLPPPRTSTDAAAGTAGGGATTTTWQTDKAVVATWSDIGTRNAWALLDGVGWRKLFAGTDGAFMALTLLAAQARQTGHHVNARDEDGVLKEMYLW